VWKRDIISTIHATSSGLDRKLIPSVHNCFGS
jgi:hypothetical protein